MALLCRIKQAKLNNFSHHFKRCYFQIHTSPLNNHAASVRVSNFYCYFTNNPQNQAICQRPAEVFNNGVRFFAAPVQVIKKKEEVKEPSGTRLNEEIKAQFVRLVTDEGHSVVPIHEALRQAKALKLDLVEVDRQARPVVCKIMDYHKERYKQQLKEKERAKSKSEVSLKKGDCKEVRFSAKTELKDLKMKADTAKRLMERGYRVKCMAMGTEDQDLGGLLSKLSVLLEDVAVVESGPRVERKQAYFIIRHVKFGPSKKGGNRSLKSASFQNAATSNTQSSPDDDEIDAPSLGQEGTTSTWSVSDANDDFDNVFDLPHDLKRTTSISTDKQMKVDAKAASSSPGPQITPPTQQPENRYARNPNKNPSPPRNPMRVPDYRSQSEPRPNFRPTGPPGQARNDGFAPRNPRLSQNETPQAPREFVNRARQFEPPASSQSSQSKGFGVFSNANTDPSRRHGSGVDVNQHNSGVPFNSSRSSGPTVIPGNLNSPKLKSDGNQGSGSDESSKWGMFSRDR